MSTKEHFDIIVIGAGIFGASCAKEIMNATSKYLFLILGKEMKMRYNY